MHLKQRRVLFTIALAVASFCGFDRCYAQNGVPGYSSSIFVPAGASYGTADFSDSQLFGLDTQVLPTHPNNTLASGSNGLDSTARILMGTNTGGDRTINFNWR